MYDTNSHFFDPFFNLRQSNHFFFFISVSEKLAICNRDQEFAALYF
jgi:hypothetical protein